MTAILIVLMLTFKPAFAIELAHVEKETTGKILFNNGRTILALFLPPQKGYPAVYEVDPSYQLPDGVKGKVVTVKARFFNERVLIGRIQCGRAVVSGLKLPIGLRQSEIGFEDAWFRDLELLLPEDPKLHKWVESYLNFLNDTHAVNRLMKSRSASAKIARIRKLVLFHTLTTYHPSLRGHLHDPAVQAFLDSASTLWAGGTHGIFSELRTVIEDALDPLAKMDCDTMLSSSLLDEDELYSQSQGLILAFQGIKKILYAR